MPAGIGKLRFAEKAACLGRPERDGWDLHPPEVYGGISVPLAKPHIAFM